MTDIKTDNKFNYNIAFMKAFFSFCVVLVHYWVPDDESGLTMQIIRNVINVSAPVFFVISFFLTADFLRKNTVKTVKKRLLRLYIPHVFWACTYFFGYLVVIELLRRYYSKADFLYNTEFINKKSLLWQIFLGSDVFLCPQFWYQFVLIVLTVVCIVIFRLSPKHGTKIIAGLALIALILQYSGINHSIFEFKRYEIRYSLGRIAESVPYAFVGIMLHGSKALDFLKKNVVIVLITCPILIVLTTFFSMHVNTTPAGFSYSGIHMILVSIICFVFFYTIPLEKCGIMAKNTLRFLSKYSFGIFCIHMGIGRVLEGVVFFRFNIKWGSFTECVFIYLASFVLAHMISVLPGNFFKKMVT